MVNRFGLSGRMVTLDRLEDVLGYANQKLPKKPVRVAKPKKQSLDQRGEFGQHLLPGLLMPTQLLVDPLGAVLGGIGIICLTRRVPPLAFDREFIVHPVLQHRVPFPVLVAHQGDEPSDVGRTRGQRSSA